MSTMRDLLRDHDVAEVVDSSHNAGGFHVIPPIPGTKSVPERSCAVGMRREIWIIPDEQPKPDREVLVKNRVVVMEI